MPPHTHVHTHEGADNPILQSKAKSRRSSEGYNPTHPDISTTKMRSTPQAVGAGVFGGATGAARAAGAGVTGAEDVGASVVGPAAGAAVGLAVGLVDGQNLRAMLPTSFTRLVKLSAAWVHGGWHGGGRMSVWSLASATSRLTSRSPTPTAMTSTPGYVLS